MSQQFKAGDVVTCMDACDGAGEWLKEGRRYTVADVLLDLVELKEVPVKKFSSGRFRPFKDASMSPEDGAAYEEAGRRSGMLPGVYEAAGAALGKLVDEKQAAYGDSFGKSGEVLKILYPSGIQPDQYRDALAVVRIVDKLFRIATQKDAFGESPFKDVAGYGLLGAKS